MKKIMDILRRECIPALSKKYAYFTSDDIRSCLVKNRIKINENTLKDYRRDLVQEKSIYSAGHGWYSAIENDFNLSLKPIDKISKIFKSTFPLLKFSCWSTEQIKHFVHHTLSNFILFVYISRHDMNTVAELLEKNGFTVYINPLQQEIAKRFKITNNTIVIRPIFSRQPNNDGADSIEKILVDLFLENSRLKIMGSQDYHELFYTLVTTYRISAAKLFSYSKRRRIKIQDLLKGQKYTFSTLN